MPEHAPTPMTTRCPHREPFIIGGRAFSADDVIAALAPYLTEHRRAKIDRVVGERTYTVAPVLEGLYDRGNVSAVIRSAEAMGYQSVHVIETAQKFKQANRVTQGAEKWLDVARWPSTGECVGYLRGCGYRILAAHVDGAEPIDAFDFSKPAAIVFGNEHEGLSDALLDAADGRLAIPMSGFTRSFNISVAAALTLYHVRSRRASALGAHGDLTQDEQRCLRAVYYLRCVKYAEHVLLDMPEARN